MELNKKNNKKKNKNKKEIDNKSDNTTAEFFFLNGERKDIWKTGSQIQTKQDLPE